MEFHRKQRSWVAGLIAFLIGVALLGLYAVLVASGEAARSRRGGVEDRNVELLLPSPIARHAADRPAAALAVG